MTRGSERDMEIWRPPEVENVTRGRIPCPTNDCASYVLSYDKQNEQTQTKNVNKNDAEYILRLHLVNVTWPPHYNVTRVTVKLWTYDNAQRHVTAFRPISEAANSWSYDKIFWSAERKCAAEMYL